MTLSTASLAAGVSRLLRGGGPRRQMIGTVLAGLILGLGSVTVGTSVVRASERDGIAGFFEMLFGGPRRAEVAPPPRPSRYANLPDLRVPRRHRIAAQTPRPRAEAFRIAPRVAARRRSGRPRAEVAMAAPGGAGDRTVCVRMCDGYLFPLGDLRARADLPVHAAACAAACPNAATSVYTLPRGETELERAVGPTGLPYRASALANVYRQRRVEDCSCQPAGGAVHLAIAEDRTLRRGDVVATEDSADVVAPGRDGAIRFTDYRQTRLPRGRGRQIEAKVGALHRDEQARRFRRALRAAGGGGIVQVAGAGPGFGAIERAAAAGPVQPVRLVGPSPFPR